ncbi:MAG: DUF3035 domain-containing protein [Pseudomonadota bacterium]
MIRPARTTFLGLAAALMALTACGSQNTERQSLLRSVGLRQPPPDEFLVVERRPLEMPPDIAALPRPDPDGINRVDPQPREEVTSLLSGDSTVPARQETGPLSPGEQALLAQSNVEAADPAIRASLAEEDRALTEDDQRYGLRTFFGRRTFDPYREEVLDPFEETQRLRAAGVQTPAAPPKTQEEPGRIF